MTETHPRRRRLGLWLILGLFVLVAASWTAVWWTAKSRVEQALADFRSSPSARNLGWREASVGGWPFRLRVELQDARATFPDGAGVGAPRLVASAYVYQPGRWFAEAPSGLVLLRPVSGDVDVRGRVRASLTDALGAQPRLAIEGRELTLTPRAGAEPFLFDTIGNFDLEAVRGPAETDEAAVLWRLAGGRGRPGGLLTFIGAGGEASARLDVLIGRISQFTGPDGTAAARRWSGAGGAVRVRELNLQAGETAAQARDGVLSVNDDGRLQGRLPVTLTRGARALVGLTQVESVNEPAAAGAAAMTAAAAGGDERTEVGVRFEGGRTFLGPFPIGPAPKFF